MISAGNNCVMVDTTAFMKRLPANVNAPIMETKGSRGLGNSRDGLSVGEILSVSPNLPLLPDTRFW